MGVAAGKMQEVAFGRVRCVRRLHVCGVCDVLLKWCSYVRQCEWNEGVCLQQEASARGVAAGKTSGGRSGTP